MKRKLNKFHGRQKKNLIHIIMSELHRKIKMSHLPPAMPPPRCVLETISLCISVILTHDDDVAVMERNTTPRTRLDVYISKYGPVCKALPVSTVV